MAIYHLHAQIISTAAGRSAVAAAAYRRATALHCAATGQVFDYGAKAHVSHTELSLPADTPAWFRTAIDGRDDHGASEVLWNAVERKEGLKGTGLAMEINIALPVELSREQRIALARDWIEGHVTAKGFVADWAVHDNDGNPHVHVMIPLRRMTEKGFGPKHELRRDAAGNVLYRDDGKPHYERMSPPMKELVGWRRSWAETANHHLAAAGLDVRIDHRSHVDAGIALEPTGHIGVTATNMAANGKPAARVAEERALRARNAEAIVADPTLLLPILTREKSVFDERDIARALFRYIDDRATFEAVRLRLGLSPELVCVSPEVVDPETETVVERARWTTREMLRTELAMQTGAARLWTEHSHDVRDIDRHVAVAMRPTLSDRQRDAVRHVTGPERIAAVVGLAGAGKSTMLGTARDAWMRSGHRVHGAALAGKAADGLQRSAGIPSRTLASWELAWSRQRDLLTRGDVLVLDEAGMVSSQQLARVVEEVERRGAKLVLVGDAMQLQPIEAGAAFRAITEAIGYAELGEVWRQSDPRMRAATVAFARGDVEAALGVYFELKLLRFTVTRESAFTSLIEAWKPDYLATKPDGRRVETLILAHTNQDVFTLNAMARKALKAEGHLSGEARFMTARGERQFAPGDRVLFLENDAGLGVKNGMLATVAAAEAGRLRVRLDHDGVGDGRSLDVDAAHYRNLDHGYAATVHKSQGATLDRVHVLATPGMDRHLAYVAMTRHRDSVMLHAARDDFLSTPALSRLMKYEVGSPIRSSRDSAALAGLMERLSRDGAKETTLDYQDRVDYREAAIGLGSAAAGPSLSDLARALDAADARAQLTADRVRPQDLRDLASAFAERRGLNSHATLWPAVAARLRHLIATLGRQRTKLEALAKRLGATIANRSAVAQHRAPALSPQPVMRPRNEAAPSPVTTASRIPLEPFLPALDLGERGLDAAAAARAATMTRLDTQKTSLASSLGRVLNNPAPLVEAIVAELPQPRAEFERRVSALLVSLDRYGGLCGKTGLFASKDARAERERAVRERPHMLHHAGKLKACHDDQLAEGRRDELAYREVLKIEVPGLSHAAQLAVQAVAEADYLTRDDAVERIVTDPALWPEVEAFARAMGKRFGAYGSIAHKAEARLPPDFRRMTPDLTALFNGAGFLAGRLRRRDELGESLIRHEELYRGRERGLTL